MEWTPDSTGLLYTDLDDAGRPARVMRHRLGTAVDQDEEVFQEPDPAAYLDISRTKVCHHHLGQSFPRETASSVIPQPQPYWTQVSSTSIKASHPPGYIGEGIMFGGRNK